MKSKVIDELFLNYEEDLYENDHQMEMFVESKKDKYKAIIQVLNSYNLRNTDKLTMAIQKYVQQIYAENSYLNEKFYKKGFKDGANVVIDCIEQ